MRSNKIEPMPIEMQDMRVGDLDEALNLAGVGWYNLKYCLILAMLLISTIMDMLGNSIILPAAVCDLQMTDAQRGFGLSIPYIGILLTSYPWGYLVDTRGRKNTLIYSCIAAGSFSLLGGLMPNVTSYMIFKFLSSLCLACPCSSPYTYISEMLPPKSRDVFVTVLNSTQIAGTAVVPLLAWAILPLDFRIPFGLYTFRPWRLLSIMFPLFYITFAILLIYCPESPKYLVSDDKLDEALKMVQDIYAANKGKKPEEFPIKQLTAPPNTRKKGNLLQSLIEQTEPLLAWSYLKWILLSSFLLFGVCVVINGLNTWIPDMLNRVLTGGGANKTACQVIRDKLNQTSTDDEACNDSIDERVLIITFIARLCCAVVALIVSASVTYIGKKKLIIITYLFLSISTVTVNFIQKEIIFAAILSITPIIILTVGPINAYAVECFPTHLRGMAVSLSMMLGRTGSVLSANLTGLMINNSCEVMFYSFGGLLFLCSAFSILLPSPKPAPEKCDDQENWTKL